MPSPKERIRTILKPKLVLDDLVFPDLNNSESQVKGGSKYQYYFGVKYPMIEINSYLFTQDELESCVIDMHGFYPTFVMSAYVYDSPFVSQSSPKDGDIASVYIRSRSDVLKPLRIDFEITSYKATKERRINKDGFFIFISGKMRIPKSRTNICTSIKATSYDALLKIADDMDLGFASNETQTSDEMVWICPNQNYEKYLDYIASHAWKNDSSFFVAYIDMYYILNFINVNTLLTDNNTMVEGIITTDMIRDYLANAEEGKSTTSAPMVLSNLPQMSFTNYYITSHELVNNSLGISMSQGYKQYHHFYEKKTKEHYALLIDPIQGENAETTKIVLRGRVNEDFYKTEAKHIWKGIQYTLDNAHNNFGYAKSHQQRNLSELNKLNLKVVLDQPNMNITKYSRVPVYIFIHENAAELKANQSQHEIDSGLDITFDKFLSGWYVVTGMKFIYNKKTPNDYSTIKHEITLSRREWSIPASTPDRIK